MRSLALILTTALLLTTPASARLIGRSAEISVGRETASLVEQYYKVDTDPVATARVQAIGRRLAAVAPDAEFPFEFHLVESGEVNAFALPGGYIYVFRGLLQLLPNDDALASVLAHEISHVYRRHSIKQFEKSLLLSAGISAVLAGTGASGFGAASNVVQAIAGISFTRHDEEDADENGIRMLEKAGYDPRAAAEAMRVVKRAAGDDKGTPDLLRTHPAPDSRIKKLTAMADDLLAKRTAQQAKASTAKPPPVSVKASLPGLAALEVEPCEWQPLAAGARWSYITKVEGAELATSIRVLEELRGDATGAYRVEYDLGRGVRAVRILAPAGDRFLSRGELAIGTTEWRVEGLFGVGTAVTEPESAGGRTIRYAGVEAVKVPAGEFQAAKVERVTSDGKPESISWYAKGVGLVKRLTSATGTTQELVSYRLPRN